MRDYRAWHHDYDDPTSALAQRLRVVQQRLQERLSVAPAGELCLISMCAGQGRDVIPVLRGHPRGPDVHAALLELDPQNVATARDAASEAGLRQLEVVETDAAISDPYEPFVPADIVLACGIFGNITATDLEGTIRNLSRLCKPGAALIWTRHWQEPEVIGNIQRWFAESGFKNLSLDALENASQSGIGVAQLVGQPLPFRRGYRFFTFIR